MHTQIFQSVPEGQRNLVGVGKGNNRAKGWWRAHLPVLDP